MAKEIEFSTGNSKFPRSVVIVYYLRNTRCSDTVT